VKTAPSFTGMCSGPGDRQETGAPGSPLNGWTWEAVLRNTAAMAAVKVFASIVLILGSACGSSSLSTTDAGTGGAPGTGGAIATGGTPATGGSVGTGGATGGSSGTGGATGGVGGNTGGATGNGGAGSDAGAGCDCGSFAKYRMCCGGRCTNPDNDPTNCGACGTRCPADKPFCDGGTCQPAPCTQMSCSAGSCCGSSCCQAGQICCSVQGPLAGLANCHTPTAEQPTCPAGCAPLCISDRNLKRPVGPVDPQDVLARLTRLPISRWRYRTEAEGIEHLGPMAQDFKQAFGLGDSDKTYNAIDAHGVAFAAIQALERVSEEQQRRIEQLEREKRALERRLRTLETR
jgi:hypothetical protein